MFRINIYEWLFDAFKWIENFGIFLIPDSLYKIALIVTVFMYYISRRNRKFIKSTNDRLLMTFDRKENEELENFRIESHSINQNLNDVSLEDLFLNDNELDIESNPDSPEILINEQDITRVSVLVPARNESINIERCVRSLMNQSYENYEVLVVDDNSSDETAQILLALKKEFINSGEERRLRCFINRQEPPENWLGKSYAVHKLAIKATGKIKIDFEH